LFKNVNEQYLFENLKLVKLDGFLDPTINFFINFSLVNLVIFGSIFVIKNSVQIGTVVAFFQYILTLAWPVMAIGFSIALTQRARASLGRINEILDITEREEERKNYFDLKGDIVIKDLSFSYEDSNRKALDGVSMNIRCSELLGITGLPGSGKTTLINLLLRIYEPEAGEIYFNGYDITQLQLNVMRSQITFVPQEPFLFGDTILNNLKIGRENATFEEVQNAAEVAQIHDDILKFPNSYDTVVGEQGITLSGGEKQRISIARAILANKSFMVFDDPLSAVDIDTERQIIKHLKDFLKENNTTTLLVSQRVSALLAADHIAVFEQGRVIEYGTPDELMEKKGYFYHLYKRQLLEETEV
jgi:ATP-binding cassette subfamily B protein